MIHDRYSNYDIYHFLLLSALSVVALIIGLGYTTVAHVGVMGEVIYNPGVDEPSISTFATWFRLSSPPA